MKAIIIATEENIAVERKKPDALARLCGLTLLERNLYSLENAGIDDFLVVCGPQMDIIKNFIENQKLNEKFNLSLFRRIDNIPVEDEHFLVLDVNIIFDSDIIKGLMTKADKGSIICVDSSPKHVEIDPSKEFTDTGIFLCDKGDLLLSENIIRKSKMRIRDVDGSFWYKINTQQDLKKAENLLLNRIPAHPPDFVCIFTRKIPAKFLIKYLIKTPITPNQVTILTLLAFFIAAFLLSFGMRNYDIIAGLFVLAALVLDCCDGGIARLKFKTSRYGEWLDGMSDTIGFYSIIFGATIGLYIRTHDILPWIVGMLLLFSDCVVSHDSSSSKIIFGTYKDAMVTTLLTSEKKTVLRRAVDLFETWRKRGFGWGVTLLLLSIGAFLHNLLIIFLILIVITNIRWLTSVIIRFKYRNAMS